MAESLETESQQSLSEDEEDTEQSPSRDKQDLDSMDVDIDDEETQDDAEDDTNKGNKTKTNSRKRKSPPDSSTSSARKKRKTDHRTHKLKIKIGGDETHFEVQTLQKIPFFKNKIIQNSADDSFKFKSASNGSFKSSERFKMDDFERMIEYIKEDTMDHVEDTEALETFVHCCDKFKIKLNPTAIANQFEFNDDYDIKSWKTSRCKVLKDLYNQNKNKSKRKTKHKKRSVVPLTNDDDEEEQDDDEDEDQEKESEEAAAANDDEEDGDTHMKKTKGSKKIKKKKLSKVVQQLNEIPQYLKLSEDEENDKRIKKDKSRRLMQRKQAIMTQEAPTEEDDDDDDCNTNGMKQKELNECEKYIKRLEDVEFEQIGLLQSMTIRRLCRHHQIETHKSLSSKEKATKEEMEKKHKKFVFRYIEDRKLIKKLKEEKKRMDDELNIVSLEDIEDAEDIGNLKRTTIVRLCKRHRIKANQKVQSMIECLEERFSNPVDEDAFIESLKEIEIDEIQNLSRDILIKLCEVHGIETTKKKKKKKKKSKKKRKRKESSSDEDEDEIALTNDEMITALEEVKQAMNEKKMKRQKNKIDKLEQVQQEIVNMTFGNHFLSISGSNTVQSQSKKKRKNAPQKMPFKDDVMGLVALCNSIATSKGNGYSVVDDALCPYQVVISEEGARTVKVMMVVARGGSVVSKKWLNHSIKEKRWLPPHNYEDRFPIWMNAANRSRESRIKRKKKMTESDADEPNGPLFAEYSIYVQDRKNVANPSALVIKHLAHCAGAHVVDKKWKTQRLKKKEVKMDDEEEEEEEEEDDDEDDEEEEEEENKKKKKKQKVRKHKVIISHSAIYKDLKIKKSNKARVVTANWLFDCIEKYTIMPFSSKYIVKPNRQATTSPVH